MAKNQTYTGKWVDPLDIHIEDIDIEDIAHSLSLMCRFGGHVKEFYSVAQHSVEVSHFCDKEDEFWGLMHDTSEAYLIDIPRPLKSDPKFGSFYRETEKQVMQVICNKYHLPSKQPESVTGADNILLATEIRDLMTKPFPLKINDSIISTLCKKIVPVSPKEAERMFLERFAILLSRSL
jgi:5'-deoxynucleotidase YfbR-like HD superfamily hydrolase